MNPLKICAPVILALIGLTVTSAWAEAKQPKIPNRTTSTPSGTLSIPRYRVLVSTDIGGTDPDDFQSMVHLLVYADALDLEGLVSSPFGPGRTAHILEIIDCYAKDYTNLKTHSSRYPTLEALGAITKQGETEAAPYAGVRRATEGSEWIVKCARRAWERPHVRFNRLTTREDRLEVFGILELALPLGRDAPEPPEARLLVETQSLIGHVAADRTIRFRFSPKAAQAYRFTIRGNVPALAGRTGGITAVLPSPDLARRPSVKYPAWWTDDPSPRFAEGPHLGAKTVNCWREEFLRDFATRLDRCQAPKHP